jgi:hypothetical protein
MPPKIEKKSMSSVAKLVSGVGPKIKKLVGQKSDTEKIREAQIKSGYNRYGRMKGVTVVTQGAGPEKLTATPTMRSISSGVTTPQKPQKTTPVKPTPTKTQRTTTGQVKKVTTGGIKQDNTMRGVIPAPTKTNIPTPAVPAKEVVKEKPIANFGRGTHQSAFAFYPSQVSDFVKGNKEWSSLIDTTSPETIKASIEKLPSDYVLSTNPQEAKKGKQYYSEQSKDALVRLLVKKYGEGKSLL